jgi:hypothetical protein
MERAGTLLSTSGELWLATTLLVRVLTATKLATRPVPRTSSPHDDLAVAALCLVLVALSSPPLSALAPLALVFGLALLLALWLDALLYRAFTIELGPRGAGSIVLSALYRELAELRHVRRFLAAHVHFTLFPVAALAALAPLVAGDGTPLRTVAAAVLLVWLTLALARVRPAITRLPATWVLVFAWVTCAGAAATGTPSPMARALIAPAVLCVVVAFASVAARRAPDVRPPAPLLDFLRARPAPRDMTSWTPRPEHRHLFDAPSRTVRRSALHGCLGGAGVVLVTVESMARTSLATFGPRGARTPFFDSLLPRAVSSRAHFCVCPMTNDAHVALYAADYTESSGFGPLDALRGAGYQTHYLSTARTALYGLRDLLDRAGFTHVVDRSNLRPEPGDDGVVSDHALVTQGVPHVARTLRSGRFFLPYRVVDRARFQHWDNTDDEGRFWNALEETDAILARLVATLVEQCDQTPLIIITADHGQSFGEHGWLSHGSAVTREQVDVPLLLVHPALPPRELPWSSHFDVLPTVLDLLGITCDHAGPGDTVFADRHPCLFLSAGRPSRATTSHYGLVCGERKLAFDRVTDVCTETNWCDSGHTLEGDEKRYTSALLTRLLLHHGLR